MARQPRPAPPDEMRPPPRREPVAPPPARDRPGDILRRALASPGARRQAFLLYEVLGPAVALRERTPDRPA